MADPATRCHDVTVVFHVHHTTDDGDAAWERVNTFLEGATLPEGMVHVMLESEERAPIPPPTND